MFLQLWVEQTVRCVCVCLSVCLSACTDNENLHFTVNGSKKMYKKKKNKV